MTPIENVLRSARVLHGVFLITVFLYLFILFQLHRAERAVNPVIIFAFAFMSLTDIAITISFRSRMVKLPEDQLRANPQDGSALARWRGGVIVCMVFAETIALFGFVLKFLGVAWNIAGIFFAVSILLMLAWTPRLDVSPR